MAVAKASMDALSHNQLGLKDAHVLTAGDMIKQFREFISPPGKKGLWLRHLNDRQLAEVYHRLKSGQGLAHVIKICQTEWNINKKSDPKSLSRALTAFKKQFIGEIQALVTKNPAEEKAKDALAARARTVVKKLDGMDRLRWLIEVQTERIEALREKEKAVMPFKQTRQEIETLTGLLDTYMGYCVRLGLVDSKPTEFNLKVKHQFNDLLGALPDQGSRVVEAGEQLFKLLEENSIVMKYDTETGSYHVNEEDLKPSDY